MFTAYPFVKYMLLSHQASRNVTLFMRDGQILDCHPKRSGKLYDPWYMSEQWLQNVCLLRNRAGIHADKSDVGLKKRQEALHSAVITYLFRYMHELYPIYYVPPCYIRKVPIA